MLPRSLPVLALLLLLVPAGALADVVQPPPLICPPGHTPSTGHSGPYCAPPPPRNCPAGYEPKVQRDDAYCEPPPDQPCPPGSSWRSSSATRTWCEGGWSCTDRECGDGSTCREAGLCVTPQLRWRGQAYEVVSTTCATDADCAGPGETCVKAKRCDPDVKRQKVQGAEETPTPQATPTPAPGESPKEPADDEVGRRPGCSVGAAAGAWSLLLIPLAVFARRRT